MEKTHYKNILDNLVSGIIAVNPEDKIALFNRTAERILKLSCAQVLGKDVRALQANLAGLLLDTLHQGKSYSRRELSLLPDDTLVGASTSQVYDANGKLLGACMVFSSLDKVRKQENLRRKKALNNYWSNAANSLAHEVKNSIVAAKTFTELFPQKYADAEFRWNLYSALKRDLQKLDRFSDELLNFARPPDPVMQPCRVDQVLDAAVSAALRARRNSEKIVVEKDYSPNIPPVSGDYHQLKQAFGCIIENALDVMDREGTLNIVIEQESGPQMLVYTFPQAYKDLPNTKIVVVKIRDSGPGIPPENLPSLFDPFFTTKEARVGLGLSFAMKIIDSHQGIIQVQSKPGEGSLVWVCLPLLSNKESVRRGKDAQTKNSDY